MMDKNKADVMMNSIKPDLEIAPVINGPVAAPFAVSDKKNNKVLCYTKDCEAAIRVKNAMEAEARLASLIMAALMDRGEKQEPKETPQDTGTTTGTVEAPAAN